MAIAQNFFAYGKFKDTWDTSKCSANLFGQHLLLRSEKMNIIFYWGLDDANFYLETHIKAPENLRYMTDSFWSNILELKELGEFEFSELGSLNETQRPLFENNTSVVFQMIRNFMLYQVEKMEGLNDQQPPSMEMGQLILKWNIETPWENLLKQSSEAFKRLYAINYSLWKVGNLHQKK
jgi:hypothetical protein